MLLEGKGLRIFISTNGAKTGFSGRFEGLGWGKLLKGNGASLFHNLRAGVRLPEESWGYGTDDAAGLGVAGEGARAFYS
jgi:hypothetical protein